MPKSYEMNMENKMKYEEAVAKLEELVAAIEDPSRDMTGLTDDVKKALELVRYCKDCIAGTKKEMEEIL